MSNNYVKFKRRQQHLKIEKKKMWDNRILFEICLSFFYIVKIKRVLCYKTWDPRKCIKVSSSTNKLSQKFTEYFEPRLFSILSLILFVWYFLLVFFVMLLLSSYLFVEFSSYYIPSESIEIPIDFRFLWVVIKLNFSVSGFPGVIYSLFYTIVSIFGIMLIQF